MAKFGNFSENGREYIITEPLIPPRHLINFTWNSEIISGVNQFATGEGVFNKKALIYSCPNGRVQLINDGRRYFYVRDEESDKYWNIAFFPVKHKPYKLTTIFGLGYSKFIHETDSILTESLTFVAPDEPVEIWRIKFINKGPSKRFLKLFPYVEWLLTGGYTIVSSYYSYLTSYYHEDINSIISLNESDEIPHNRYGGFISSNIKATGYSGSKRQFLGIYGEVTRPQIMIEGNCSNKPASCEDLAGALEIPIELNIGQEKEATILIGSTSDYEETKRVVTKIWNGGYITRAYQQLLEKKDKLVKTTHIETPDKKINNVVNIWSKHQISLCAEFGRDGSRGFRDTLSDAWAIISFDSKLARSKIIEALHYQTKEGWAIRGWMPIITKRYSDGPIWITLAITQYIKETGDKSILDEVVPYYDGSEGSVLEHMLKGARQLSRDKGTHGLCLAFRGDWNDSLDWMGKDGKGESVFTSMGHYKSLLDIAELAEKVLNDYKLASEMRAEAKKIQDAVEQNAWDGNWYIAGYSDAGNKVGSHQNTEGKIYLTPQAWAAYTGIASREHLSKCLKAVDELLESDHGSLMCYPHYSRVDKNVGRLTVVLPGMYENAAPYCQGTAFKIVGDLCAGRPDAALRTFLKVLPDNDNHPSEISGVEPYAFTNQYLGPQNLRAGFSITGWITGTAGWMYRAMTNYFCGIQPSYRGFHLKPCLPKHWLKVSVSITLRGTNYFVDIVTLDGKESSKIEVDGKQIKDNFIPYTDKDNVRIKVIL